MRQGGCWFGYKGMWIGVHDDCSSCQVAGSLVDSWGGLRGALLMAMGALLVVAEAMVVDGGGGQACRRLVLFIIHVASCEVIWLTVGGPHDSPWVVMGAL